MYNYHVVGVFVCRLKCLASRLSEFHLLIDSEAELKLLVKNPLTDKTWSVFVEVDCGHGRSELCSSSSTLCHLSYSHHYHLHCHYCAYFSDFYLSHSYSI